MDQQRGYIGWNTYWFITRTKVGYGFPERRAKMYGNVMKAWDVWKRNENSEKGKMWIQLNGSPATLLRLRKAAK